MAPTSRITSTRIVELTFTSMPSRENFLKPLSSVSTRYRPLFMFEKT